MAGDRQTGPLVFDPHRRTAPLVGVVPGNRIVLAGDLVPRLPRNLDRIQRNQANQGDETRNRS